MLDRVRKTIGDEESPDRESAYGAYRRKASALLLARLPSSLKSAETIGIPKSIGPEPRISKRDFGSFKTCGKGVTLDITLLAHLK